MEEQYTVYIRTDAAGRIVEINSSAFLADTAGWTAIDEVNIFSVTKKVQTASLK